jgi:GntR family transcriptional regulator/MocR family aminotransferase
MRDVYGARRSRLLQALEHDFAGLLEPIPSAAGLHLAARLHGADAATFVQRARENDVGVYDLKRFFWGKSTVNGVAFGFGAIGERDIEAGLARLLRRRSGKTR